MPRRWTAVHVGVLAGFFVVLAGVLLVTWHAVSPSTSPATHWLAPEPLPAIPRTQRPLTLDPGTFEGDAAAAYRLARERPALLERMACYCGCYGERGHQNLLDCFRDTHAAGCDICLRAALRAAALEASGYTTADVKALLDIEFSRKKQ